MRANVSSYVNANNEDLLECDAIQYDVTDNNLHPVVGKNCKSANFTFGRKDKKIIIKWRKGNV